MSRNIDTSNQILFENIRLAYYCSEEYRMDDDADDLIRYVYGNEEEKRWLKSFKIYQEHSLNYGYSGCFYLGEYNNEMYIFSVGIGEFTNVPEGLINIDLNAGCFLAICSELQLMVREDYPALKIYNQILSQHSQIEGYTGHRLVKPLFPSITVLKIDSAIFSGDPKNIELIASLLISMNKEYIKLPFNNDTLVQMQQLCYKNFQLFRYENLFQALIASAFKFTFLDLYRSIEMLYQVCYISELENILKIPTTSLLTAIDSSLKWKPNERNTLCKIINEISPSNRQIFTNKLPKIIKSISGDSISSPDHLWGWIYDLRCNIVHLKVLHSKIIISDKNWNVIFQGLIEIIIAAYDKYDNIQNTAESSLINDGN